MSLSSCSLLLKYILKGKTTAVCIPGQWVPMILGGFVGVQFIVYIAYCAVWWLLSNLLLGGGRTGL